MTNFTLYITFFVLGLILFLGIYLYSSKQFKNNGASTADGGSNSAEKKPGFFSRKFGRKKQISRLESDEPLLSDDTFSVGGVVAKVSKDVSGNNKVDGTKNNESPSSVSLPSSSEEGEAIDDFSDYESVPLDQLGEELENSSLANSPEDQEGQIYEDGLGSEKSSEPLIDGDVSASESKAPKSRAEKFKSGADALEIVAKISGPDFVLRDKCLAVYRKYDYLFTRKLGIFGRNSLTHVWESIELADKEAKFDDIAVSLQLADKTGAMTRKESNTFSTLALEIADSLDKNIIFSMDFDDSVERGRMLDELARKYDAMVVSNIIPKRRTGFRSTDLQSCARDLQMVQSSNGVFNRFAKLNGVNTLRYSLAIADADGKYVPLASGDSFEIEDVVVFLNVPLVERPVEAFDLMIADARKLAAWLDGKVVDKNAKNITSRTLDKLSNQIAVLEKEMQSDGLIPGDTVCKKLF